MTWRSMRARRSPIEGSNGYDFAEHTFLNVGDRRDVRAMNVNTMDEVPELELVHQPHRHRAT